MSQFYYLQCKYKLFAKFVQAFFKFIKLHVTINI